MDITTLPKDKLELLRSAHGLLIRIVDFSLSEDDELITAKAKSGGCDLTGGNTFFLSHPDGYCYWIVKRSGFSNPIDNGLTAARWNTAKMKAFVLSLDDIAKAAPLLVAICLLAGGDTDAIEKLEQELFKGSDKN